MDGIGLGNLHQPVDRRLRQDDGQQAVLEGVARKYVRKARRNHRLMPISASAQAACSRLEPQPKLSPAINIGEPAYSALSNRLPGSLRNASNAPLPSPERLIVFSHAQG
jgi:hypothetical protein